MNKRHIVCLCGSTRFESEFHRQDTIETLKGFIVLSGSNCNTNDPQIKQQLCLLHLDKIDLADEVLVINVGGYIGEHTLREIAYAFHTGKPIRYMEPLVDGEERELIARVILPIRETYYSGV